MGKLLLITNIINHSQQILLRSILSTIIGMLVIYIGTNWVLRTFKSYKFYKSLGRTVSEQRYNEEDDTVNTPDLIKTLNTEQGFECFLLHLVNELQLETMLFVIECLQFKQEIKTRLNAMRLDHQYDKSSAEWLKLNYIMHDVRDSNEQNIVNDVCLFQINLKKLGIPKDPRLSEWSIYHFAVHLYDKYIEDGASLQLGISAECERFIYSYFRDRAMSPQTVAFPAPQNKKNNTFRKLSSLLEKNNEEQQDELEDVNKPVLENQDSKTSEDEDIDDEQKDATFKYTKTASDIPEESPEAVRNETVSNMYIDGVRGNEQNVDVIYDLFKLYDDILMEIWNIISKDIFNRFRKTTEYINIYEKIYNVKYVDQQKSNFVPIHVANNSMSA